MQIHISRDGQILGPYTLEDIRAYLTEGRILPSDLAWFDGASQWMPLTAVPGFVDPRPPPNISHPAPPPFPTKTSIPPVTQPSTTSAVFPTSAETIRQPGPATQKPLTSFQGCLVSVVAVAILLIIIGSFTGRDRSWILTPGGNGLKEEPKLPSKAEWRAKVVNHYGQTAQLNIVYSWKPTEFKSLMGEPESTQTIGDQAYWYYQCSDGMIQLELYAPNLAVGVMQGKINDY